MKKVRIGLLSLCLLAVGAVAQTSAPGVTAIFVEDQRDRGLPLADNGRDLLSEAEAKKLPHVSDDAMGRRDVARRARVAVLLKEGLLKTGRDFFEASLVFQHGATADDYLLAHVLAMDAMAKGDTSARGLAAATLDRYLQVAGKKQVFGTQYLDAGYAYSLEHAQDKNLDVALKTIPASAQTLGPYDEGLLPDALRADFCVVPQREQKAYIAEANAGKPVALPEVKDCKR